jgi:hypothetical protein
MPRRIEKTIHGKPVAHHIFVSAIFAAIEEFPEGAKTADVIVALGPEWDNAPGKKYISTMLINLFNRGVIERIDEKGAYVSTQFGRRGGVNKFVSDEKSILQAIRAEGGFCQFRDIMEAHDVRPHGSDTKDYINHPVYQRIVKVIRESELIRQDTLKRGVYNLPWSETLSLPLRGRYAALLIEAQWEELRGKTPTDQMEKPVNSWRKLRDSFFANVGETFKMARRAKGVSAATMLEDTKVWAAMAKFVRVAPRECAVIRQDWFDHTGVEVDRKREAGATFEEIEAYRAERDEELRIRMAEWLYKRFERGSLGAHVHAPLIFYTAVADYLECCPASLSRGMIAMQPYAVRLRPQSTRRSGYDIMIAESDMEIHEAQRARWLAGEFDEEDEPDEVAAE